MNMSTSAQNTSLPFLYMVNFKISQGFVRAEQRPARLEPIEDLRSNPIEGKRAGACDITAESDPNPLT